MDIRKWAEKYSTDCRLKYNSEATQENYISQVRSFLYKFKDEVEPKSIPNDKIKEWLLEAKTTMIYIMGAKAHSSASLWVG